RESKGGACVGAGLDAALLHAQLTIHHLDQLLCRAEAQNSEAITGLELVVGTGHAVEAAAKDPCRHASARIANVELKRHQSAAVLSGELDSDAASIGAVDGAVQQGHQDLLEPARIADGNVWHLGPGLERDVEALRPGRLGNEPQTVFDRRTNVKRMQRQLELSALHGHGVRSEEHTSELQS